MRDGLLKFLSGVILITFLFLCDNPSATAAQITKKLDNDTRIMPPGFIVATWSQIPKFKKGTVVTLNMYGEVLEGILAEAVDLPYETGTPPNVVKPTATTYTPPTFVFVPSTNEIPTNRVLFFKDGTKVMFNDRGEVTRGTVCGTNINIVLDMTNHIAVSDGEVSFHKNGILALCTLAKDSYLRPIGWSHIVTVNNTDAMISSGFVEFEAGKPVFLNEKGEVLKGTLNKKTTLRTLKTYALSNTVDVVENVFEAKTEVEFDEKGIAAKVAK